MLLCVLANATLSCAPEESAADRSLDLSRLEANLLPAIVFAGEEHPRYQLEERMAYFHVPAVSLAYFEDGQIQWARAYGVRRAGQPQAVDPETMFQAASISKPVAATAMLRLVEEGLLDLDADVNAYLTDWKVEENDFTTEEKVTLRRLVSHSAGLTVSGFPGYAAGEKVPTTVQVLAGGSPANTETVRPDTVPGTRWRYSGGGYTVMQRVLEEVRGEPFPAMMNDLVLQPLGMDRSTYQQPLDSAQWENAARAHNPDGSVVTGGWHTYPEMAAAGLWTTPSDLARWAIAIQRAYNGQDESLLSQTMARAMLTPQFGDTGLGPGLSGSGDSLRFSHGGSNRGFRCYVFAFARAGGPGFALMTNGSQGYELGQEILRGLSDLKEWGIFEPEERTAISLPSDTLALYAGRYRFAEERVVEVFMESDTLHFQLPWNGYSSILLPEGNDRFFDPRDGTTVFFPRNERGVVVALQEGNSRAERLMD